MKYRILQTSRAKADIYQLAAYIRWNLNNPKAASDFLQRYEREVELLGEFPFGFKETGIVYKGHTIRLKAYDTYHIFFVTEMDSKRIIIIRVLKKQQDWKRVLRKM